MGSCASSTGERRREISAHSFTEIVPSGRSAMICTVVPLRPDKTTRTKRKPKSVSTGSAMAASWAAKPVSPMKRASDARPLTALSPAKLEFRVL
jgi:hypothetical protein